MARDRNDEELPRGRQWKEKPDSLGTYEEPVTRPDPHPGSSESTVTTHPAFGQIGAARVTGQAFLYGSDFEHRGYMSIRIHESELHRDLSRDWHFERGRVVEVHLSEAQWATFISTPNMGSGVPCTIGYTRAGHMEGHRPYLPAPPSRREQYEAEAAARGEAMLAALETLDARIAELKVSEKQKNELRGHVLAARRELTSGLPFVAKSFAKYTQAVVERAKVEVAAYAMRTLTRMGLERLLGHSEPPLAWIDGRKAEGGDDDDAQS